MADKNIILMICQFGLPVRGLSPYGDALIEALRLNERFRVLPVDYAAPYPGWLHPGGAHNKYEQGQIHWAKPQSWNRAAHMPGAIVHFQHWLSPMAIYLTPLARLARRAGKKIVITVHNPEAHESATSLPLDNLFLKQADRLIVHDRQGMKILKKRMGCAFDDKLIEIIPHGITVRKQPPAPEPGDHARLGLDPSRRYICMFGNLRGYKGIDILLKAWTSLVGQIDDVDLVIAGRLWSGKSGPARIMARLLGSHSQEDLIQKALSQPVLSGRVHLWEGFQPDEKLDTLLRLSEIAVFPYSHFSSQSGAACRAAGLGCPVLASNIGGLPELAINENWLVEPGNAGALAAALESFLTNPAALIMARQTQLQRVRPMSWEVVAERHADLYCELLS
ncbi:MAG: glycosyltransferase family 4 protein [Gammaproteobacteria bacterium]